MTDNRSQQLVSDTHPDPDQLDFFGVEPRSQLAACSGPDAGSDVLCRIGHDLRTALNAILGFSEIMTQKLHGPLGHPKYDEYAQHVRFSGQALLTVSDEVLALASRRVPASDRRMQSA